MPRSAGAGAAVRVALHAPVVPEAPFEGLHLQRVDVAVLVRGVTNDVLEAFADLELRLLAEEVRGERPDPFHGRALIYDLERRAVLGRDPALGRARSLPLERGHLAVHCPVFRDDVSGYLDAHSHDALVARLGVQEPGLALSDVRTLLHSERLGFSHRLRTSREEVDVAGFRVRVDDQLSGQHHFSYGCNQIFAFSSQSVNLKAQKRRGRR